MYESKLKALLITAKTTIKLAMLRLNKTGEQILFVVNEQNKILGTLTDGDIRRGITNGLSFNSFVEEIMSQKFTSVSHGEQNNIKLVRKLMLESQIEQLPVLDDEELIVDVISWKDILDEAEYLSPRQLYSNHVVIMAGGKGARLDPFTKILPKPLIPIGGKPVIELIMERFHKNGFSKFIYTLNYKKEYLKLFLRDNNFPYEIDWVEEDEYYGTAGSLSLLNDKVNDTYFVVNCDSLLDVDYGDVLKWHREHNASITILGCHNEFKIPFGVLELSNGSLERITEKPAHDIIVNTGVYVMEPHISTYIPKEKRIDMNKLIEMVVKKEKVSVYPIYNGWFDLGQWEEYNKTVKHFEEYSRHDE